VRKRSREFARNPVEEYGIIGEQKANIISVGDFDSYHRRSGQIAVGIVTATRLLNMKQSTEGYL
jgi:hypothetical protein